MESLSPLKTNQSRNQSGVTTQSGQNLKAPQNAFSLKTRLPDISSFMKSTLSGIHGSEGSSGPSGNAGASHPNTTIDKLSACRFQGEFNCASSGDANLAPTSTSHRSVTGEVEAGFHRTDPNKPGVSIGASLEVTSVIPGIGGGTVGFNLQLGGDVTGLYFYHPWTVKPEGFALGGTLEANIAYGKGGWTGDFDNYSASGAVLAGSYFQSPDGSWRGLSGGGTAGAPIGATYTRTYYRPIITLD